MTRGGGGGAGPINHQSMTAEFSDLQTAVAPNCVMGSNFLKETMHTVFGSIGF